MYQENNKTIWTVTVIFLIITVVISAFNQMQIYDMSNMGSSPTPTGFSILPAVRAEVIPSGVPKIYGKELGVSYDDVAAETPELADETIRKLGDLDNKKIAIWGLSFKPHTDDMRSAPSINIIKKLLAKGAKIFAYDPAAFSEARKIFNNRVEYALEMYDCLKGADALVLITEWPQFKEPDFNKMKELLKNPIIFDGRNIYSPAKMKELGFKYISIGRQAV